MLLVMRSPNKHCSSDPGPARIDCLVPVLSKIVNISLQTGYFPNEWKNSLVTPILKKAGLENYLCNYRPISNLPFIYRLVERASIVQFSDHMGQRRPLPSYQSAYRP